MDLSFYSDYFSSNSTGKVGVVSRSDTVALIVM